MSAVSNATTLLENLKIDPARYTGGTLPVTSPVTGEVIANVQETTPTEAETVMAKAQEAFAQWRMVPAPRRGEFVRLLGEELRAVKDDLGQLVTLEVGKVVSEGLGEVQEMIDICDFATGLSRQLDGRCFPSERTEHRITEQWHPIGPVGIISAFNFPVAVWSWNAALALVCGDSLIWKPSEKSPLTALAIEALFQRTCERFGDDAPAGLMGLLIGDSEIGKILVDDARVPIISATGSTAMGRAVGQRVAARFGRTILELGGNNATIVTPSADLDMALRAIAFGAIGTAGQRCTTTRRLIVHSSVYDQLVPKLINVYHNISVGSPLDSDALVGPLIDGQAFEAMQATLAAARDMGAMVHGGERVDVNGSDSYYARPALVEVDVQSGPVVEETFAPILYVMKYDARERL